jgi:hypothetical protein
MENTEKYAGGAIHFQGAREREARCQLVATCVPPRRVSVVTACRTSNPSLIPTPAKPMPSPRRFVLAAMSWNRASSRRCIPRPSSAIVTTDSEGLTETLIVWAPASSAFATPVRNRDQDVRKSHQARIGMAWTGTIICRSCDGSGRGPRPCGMPDAEQERLRARGPARSDVSRLSQSVSCPFSSALFQRPSSRPFVLRNSVQL